MSTPLLGARTAPIREGIVAEITDLLTSYVPDGEVPPSDSADRVDYRLGFVFAPYDDDDPGDRTQPVRDLLTDVLHLCADKGWDIDYLVGRAAWMQQQEAAEWAERERQAFEEGELDG